MKKILFKEVQFNQRFKHSEDGRWCIKKSASTYLRQVEGLFGYRFLDGPRMKALCPRIESEDARVFVDEIDYAWSMAPMFWEDTCDPDALPDFTGKLKATMG